MVFIRFVSFQLHCHQDRIPREEAVVPPPPSPLEPARGVDAGFAQSKLHCPLCHRLRSNPAACVSRPTQCTIFVPCAPCHVETAYSITNVGDNLAMWLVTDHFLPAFGMPRVVMLLVTKQTASGYVFCFTCLYNYLEKNHRCPVTLIPAEADDIVRVYEDQSLT